MKTERKQGRTPLSRSEHRLQYWRDVLKARLEAKNTTMVGMVSVSLMGDKAMEAQMVKDAEAAVKDWEAVVRAVSLHGELVEALRSIENADTLAGAKGYARAILSKAEA